MSRIKNLEDTEKYIVINRNRLEDELEFQPELYLNVAEISAEKISVRDGLKEERDRIWAEEFLTAKMSGDKAPSDKVAEATADSSPRYRKITQEYLEAKKEADIWWSKREAFQSRTEMLKELAKIMATGIYSSMDVKEKAKEKEYKTIQKRMRKED